MKSPDRWFAAGCAAAMAILILDGKTALEGARIGIALCIESVIPSMFPFFIFSNLLNGVLYGKSSKLLHTIGYLFRMPRGSESILIPAFLGGYPLGAQCIGQVNRLGKLSDATSGRLLCFCNNAGPAFLFGIVGKMFLDYHTIWLCWGIQFLCALTIASFLGTEEEQVKINYSSSVTIPQALNDSIRAMSNVCGWIIFFRIVISFCQRWFLWIFPVDINILFCGLLELSNGCCMLNQIVSESVRFIWANVMLSFGGICVIMQTSSVIGNISLRKYLISKTIQAILAALFSLAVLYSVRWIFLIWSLILIFFRSRYENKGSIPIVSGV